MSLSKIKNWILKYRFPSLLISATIGVLLSKYCYSFLYNFITNTDPASEKATPLLFVLLALPTGALLWLFRTHDTRENIHQDALFDALQMLTDNMVVRREIATQRLIDLTEKAPEYKETVKLAFIKVLKSFPKKNMPNPDPDIGSIVPETERRSYAQHMLKWFNSNNYTAEDLDLDGCIFELQDFTIEENNQKLFKLFTEKQFKNLSFIDSNIEEGFDLTDVKLKNTAYSYDTKFPNKFEPEKKGMQIQ